MSRLLVPGSKLTPRPTPTAAIAVIFFVSVAIGMLTYLTGNMPLTVLTGVIAAVTIAGIVALYLRDRERHDDADLFLQRVHGILGWPDPHRGQAVPSRYRGSWVGKPTRLKVTYNPLVDRKSVV